MIGCKQVFKSRVKEVPGGLIDRIYCYVTLRERDSFLSQNSLKEAKECLK